MRGSARSCQPPRACPRPRPAHRPLVPHLPAPARTLLHRPAPPRPPPGDIDHLDISVYAFEKLADLKWGVIPL